MKLGFSIGPYCFDYGLVIPHYGTIVVGPSNRIGKYSVLHTCVCITDTSKSIGEGLYCSTGCKLTFKGSLGNNVTIGANAVVTKEITTDNILLTSLPAAVKSKRKAWYMDDETYNQRVFNVEHYKNKYYG